MIDQQRYTLIKESAVNYAADALTTDTQLCQMFNDLYKLNQFAEEHVYLVAFTNKGRPLGVFEISHGSRSASFLQPREMFMRLLLAGASSFAIAHFHPSGDCTPSNQDIKITRIMKEAGKMMGNPIVEHIIAGNPGHYSFCARGFFDN